MSNHMIDKIKYVLGYTNTRPVFVIGTGRSGTHWLGYTLGNHSEVRATVEVQPMFELSTRMALDIGLENRLFGRLVRTYRWQLFKSSPKIYLDKTHPNIWIADKLKEAFPLALFIGIERNPYATVASMIKHKGVSDWHKNWKEYPIPNRFLGITPELALTYNDLPFAKQCAIRWKAHHERFNELKTNLKESLTIIIYEDFVHNTQRVASELQNFLGITDPLQIPEVKFESLKKWEKQLSSTEIKHIQEVVGFSPSEYA